MGVFYCLNVIFWYSKMKNKIQNVNIVSINNLFFNDGFYMFDLKQMDRKFLDLI